MEKFYLHLNENWSLSKLYLKKLCPIRFSKRRAFSATIEITKPERRLHWENIHWEGEGLHQTLLKKGCSNKGVFLEIKPPHILICKKNVCESYLKNNGELLQSWSCVPCKKHYTDQSGLENGFCLPSISCCCTISKLSLPKAIRLICYLNVSIIAN